MPEAAASPRLGADVEPGRPQVPVMLGAIVFSGAKYPLKKWVTVALIIGGCVLVTVGKSKKPSASQDDSDAMGLFCLFVSLACDGAVISAE